MDKLDQIHNEIITLQNMFAAGFLLLLIFMSGVVMYLRGFRNTHLLENFQKATYKLETNFRRTLKNWGIVKPVPDINPALELAFYGLIRKWHESGVDYKLTENYLFKDWKRIGGNGKPQLRKMLDRAEGIGILRRKNPDAGNSQRILGSYAKLREQTSSPQTTSQAVKHAETGIKK